MDDKNELTPGRLLSKAYDFILVIVTIAVLSLLGFICLYGTVYSFNKSRMYPEWTQTFEYQAYFGMMNSMAVPFALILLAVMALCIPRRIIPRKFLFPLAIVLLLVSFYLSIAFSPVTALTLVIAFSALVQIFVTFAVISGSEYLVFEKLSTIEKIGSSVLHLGVLVFLLDLVAFQGHPQHINIFWLATAFITLGSLFIFYPEYFKRNKLI